MKSLAKVLFVLVDAGNTSKCCFFKISRLLMVKWLEDLGPAVFGTCKIRKMGRDSKRAATRRGISVRHCRMAPFSYPGIDDTAFQRKIENSKPGSGGPEKWMVWHDGSSWRALSKLALPETKFDEQKVRSEECVWVALPSEPVLSASQRATRFRFDGQHITLR